MNSKLCQSVALTFLVGTLSTAMAQTPNMNSTNKTEAQKHFKQRIVTEIVPLKKFYAAKLDHQNYYRTHPNQGYCRAVIRPKVEKFEKKLKESKEAGAAH